MAIIHTHEITLYQGGQPNLVLRPLSDAHLPLLYRWCADPEVLYWTEGGPDRPLSYGPETVRRIYGAVSREAHCFLVEADGLPIGECWLQRMNLPEVRAMYLVGTDVRRIDMAIGEKACWGKGLGTRMIGMLVDFAFCGESVDALHCFCEDYNIRSRRVWEKNGFIRTRTEPLPQKGQAQLHYVLTRHTYLAGRRCIPPADQVQWLPLSALTPSQLYISAGKLALVDSWCAGAAQMDPLPYIILDGVKLLTDGHTRAVWAHLHGETVVPCYPDPDRLDLAAYAQDLVWCRQEGVLNIEALAGRIVSHGDYERLWRRRCMELSQQPSHTEKP